jgi:hypothetical protein
VISADLVGAAGRDRFSLVATTGEGTVPPDLLCVGTYFER